MTESYVRPERLWLKMHPQFSETWVHRLIMNDPSILGLGDLEVRDHERIQPGRGRLDILLQHPETKRRYEVELQLGATDETHIIRTVEYWDIERKRYPQYDHCAVLIAEHVTSRFLNVISLFNGSITFIAIQMQALRVAGSVTMVFTTVVDEMTRGVVDEDEEADAAPADRGYWEKRGTKATVILADDLFRIVQRVDPSLQLKYNKFYIGLTRDGQPFNFVYFQPRKNHLNLYLKLPESDDINSKIDNAGLAKQDYETGSGRYRIVLAKADIDGKTDVLFDLIRLAHEARFG